MFGLGQKKKDETLQIKSYVNYKTHVYSKKPVGDLSGITNPKKPELGEIGDKIGIARRQTIPLWAQVEPVGSLTRDAQAFQAEIGYTKDASQAAARRMYNTNDLGDTRSHLNFLDATLHGADSKENARVATSEFELRGRVNNAYPEYMRGSEKDKIKPQVEDALEDLDFGAKGDSQKKYGKDLAALVGEENPDLWLAKLQKAQHAARSIGADATGAYPNAFQIQHAWKEKRFGGSDLFKEKKHFDLYFFSIGPNSNQFAYFDWGYPDDEANTKKTLEIEGVEKDDISNHSVINYCIGGNLASKDGKRTITTNSRCSKLVTNYYENEYWLYGDANKSVSEANWKNNLNSPKRSSLIDGAELGTLSGPTKGNLGFSGTGSKVVGCTKVGENQYKCTNLWNIPLSIEGKATIAANIPDTSTKNVRIGYWALRDKPLAQNPQYPPKAPRGVDKSDKKYPQPFDTFYKYVVETKPLDRNRDPRLNSYLISTDRSCFYSNVTLTSGDSQQTSVWSNGCPRPVPAYKAVKKNKDEDLSNVKSTDIFDPYIALSEVVATRIGGVKYKSLNPFNPTKSICAKSYGTTGKFYDQIIKPYVDAQTNSGYKHSHSYRKWVEWLADFRRGNTHLNRDTSAWCKPDGGAGWYAFLRHEKPNDVKLNLPSLGAVSTADQKGEEEVTTNACETYAEIGLTCGYLSEMSLGLIPAAYAGYYYNEPAIVPLYLFAAVGGRLLFTTVTEDQEIASFADLKGAVVKRVEDAYAVAKAFVIENFHRAVYIGTAATGVILTLGIDYATFLAVGFAGVEAELIELVVGFFFTGVVIVAEMIYFGDLVKYIAEFQQFLTKTAIQGIFGA